MKLFLVRRRLLTGAACLLVAAAMFYIVNHPAVVGTAATTRQLPIYCVQRDYKVLSISFDAAWGNEDTQMLIDILGKYNIKATFFVVGDWVDKYPESVKALSDAGHEVMNHSNTHAHMSKLSRDEIISDVNACNDKIEAVTGTRPTLIRPPYGEYDDNVITSIRSIGMEPIQWDVDVYAIGSSPHGTIEQGADLHQVSALFYCAMGGNGLSHCNKYSVSVIFKTQPYMISSLSMGTIPRPVAPE